MVDGRPLPATHRDVTGGDCCSCRLEHRRVHDPDECPVLGVDQARAVADLDAGSAKKRPGRGLLPGGEEDAVAGLCPTASASPARSYRSGSWQRDP